MFGNKLKIVFIRFLFAITVLLCVASTVVYDVRAQTRTDEEIPNEFIFRVILMPNWTISDAIFAYELNGKYYLPIGALSEGFEFFVDMQPEDLFAQGFASREENSYVIDGRRLELTLGGVREELDEDSILISDYVGTDDIYVQLEVLTKIWPVQLTIDLSNITIQASAEEELSFMRDKTREQKRAMAEARAEQREKAQKLLPFQKNEYSWFGRPVIDYQATYEYDADTDDKTGSNVFTGVQQIGKMVADYSANFALNQEDRDFDRPDTVRMRLSRNAYGDESLLVPGVKSLELGDVNLRQRDLVSNTKSGRGIKIANNLRDRSAEFDRITIEGVGPAGWDIELYNNDEFIEFGAVQDDGQYFFEDIVLNYGNNEIKVLFFGPQGQVREETRSYNAGGSMLSPGDFNYQLGLLDTGRQFILLDNDARTTPRGVTKTGTAFYGVNEKLTVFGSYTETPETTGDHKYISAGIATDTALGLVELEAYQELGGGNALGLDHVAKFLGFRTNLAVALYNGFESSEAGLNDNKKRFDVEGQANRNLNVFGVPLGLRANVRYTKREDGNSNSNIDVTQTYSRSGIRASNTISSRLINSEHQNTTGALSSTVREGDWQFRGALNYNVSPITEFTNANGEIRYKMDNSFQAAYNIGYNLLLDRYTTGVQLGYDFDKFLGTFDADYTRGEGWRLGLRASMSLHPHTMDDSYDLSSKSRRNNAPVRAHVFLDRDADGVYTEGTDEPIEDAKIELGGAPGKLKTDENGYVIATAAPGAPINISLHERSLSDPYFVPATKGFSTNPLRGKMIDASFPVLETGSIEGTVFRTDYDRALAGLTVHLINSENESIMSTVTGFDGYYAFEFVMPDTYRLDADPSHGVTMRENQVELTPADLFVYGNNLFVDVPQTEVVSRLENESGADGVAGIEPAAGTPSQDTSVEYFGPMPPPAVDSEPAAQKVAVPAKAKQIYGPQRQIALAAAKPKLAPKAAPKVFAEPAAKPAPRVITNGLDVATGEPLNGLFAHVGSMASYKVAEAEKHRLKERYADVLNKTPFNVYEINIDGKTYFRVVGKVDNRVQGQTICDALIAAQSPGGCKLIDIESVSAIAPSAGHTELDVKPAEPVKPAVKVTDSSTGEPLQGMYIHVGSETSPERASAEQSRMKERYTAIIGNVPFNVYEVQVNGKAYYRIVAKVANREEGETICDALIDAQSPGGCKLTDI